MNPMRNRLKAAADTLKSFCYSHVTRAEKVMISQGDYEFAETFDSSKREWTAYESDETWGGTDRHYWFLTTVSISGYQAGAQIRAVLNTGATDIWNTDNPQILVYVNGVLSGTMDMNHQDFILTERAEEGQVFELAFYAYSNSSGKTNFFHLDIAAYEEEAAKFYYDFKVPFEAADLLEEDDLERIETFKILGEALNLVDFRRPGSGEFLASLTKADEWLLEHYYKDRPENPVTVHSIGHTHIDVAWKWPLKQTRQKVVRSFQTVLNLMKRYPEYKFMSSQPQLYEFVKEEAPGVFAQIKERIKEGRWETEGAMWLEPDCNLASGESLIRHILYGKRFFEKEMGGTENEVLWLPDVFGYSAAIPQIMKQSGLPYFMTTKLGWNEWNQFPSDVFRWKGIDGSEVLTYLISTRDYLKKQETQKNFSTTYNGRQDARQIMGTWQRFQNKDVSKEVLTCYGYGDGGGGPTEEMLEQSRRLEFSVVRAPKTKQTFVKDFFHMLEEQMDRKQLPVWEGELYLETHRGTYTSMAKNKKYNRTCEFLNGDAEFYGVLDYVLTGSREYPFQELEKNWKLLLLNQFHDILPGSSIKEVYEDSNVQYEQIIKSGTSLIDHSRGRILHAAGLKQAEESAQGLVVWNQMSFSRTGIVELNHPIPGIPLLSQQTADETTLYLAEEVPSKGYGIYGMEGTHPSSNTTSVFGFIETDEKGNPKKVTTTFYEMEFGADGTLLRLFDRNQERELIKEGARANELLVFDDRPLEFDAWNIDASYEEKVWKIEEVTDMKVLENGALRGIILIKKRFLDSEIEQKIYFYQHTARIDFKTTMNWREHQMLLKTAFPLDILCKEANYDIQFGNVSRPTHENTTWDQARFEVCAHKWADISEPGYGAALLNDCKYGYDIHDSVLRLTLLKSGIFPNPDADQGEHTFTYALFPHKGDFRTGGVVQEAYDLNCPLFAAAVRGETGHSYSFLTIEEENIIADTVKLSEDGDGIIIRMYEAYGMRTKAHITFHKTGADQVMECTCLEEEKTSLSWENETLVITLKPYEIKTIKLKR
ncbi:glycoside hydrolase family 38 C-terminal domain-containing protein [Clostridium sp. HBUAS56010]|uniref:alpha-mannosidase n=1 Tax=Clostridium sp. HBUAS56010 TaxID=2571127 RepID=UPI0011786EBD|nr:glycoside hydrolase family 38 C-terminal domain-containing protein [Clostridium sp. HBUAS56010]